MNVEKRLIDNYRGETVFITGHTGFKGGWLACWLNYLGANVIGYSTTPPSDPSFFNAVVKSSDITDIRADINDYPTLRTMIQEHQPSYIFHLAAQPIVRESYVYPRQTFLTNVMGTANVLECARHLREQPVCVCITSDKCYANKEWDYAYRENDMLGGHDPYSASKAAAEIVIESYRKSFFSNTNRDHIASARAGNVIGGGDWAPDRIIPDCIRSLIKNEEIIVRNPAAVRPWQFVLEPIFGYMWLGLKMNENEDNYSGAWNFGPNYSNCVSVGTLVDKLVTKWGSGSWVNYDENTTMHEANLLKLDIAKSVTRLGWQPLYSLNKTIDKITEWYKDYYKNPHKVTDISIVQIKEYMNDIDKQYT